MGHECFLKSFFHDTKKAKAKGTYGKPTSQQDKSVIRNDCTHFNDWAQRDIKWAAGFKKPTDVVGHCGSTHWNQVWKKNQKHLLDCQFSVTAGKTLTIQAGTVIYANKVGINGAYCSSAVEKQCTDKNECIKLASGRKFVKGKSCISNTPSLVVMKGAKIFAKGTAAAPITFTANLNSKDMPTKAKESTDSSTVLENCEVALNLDDGFEFFGGTVNGKYLSSLYVGDDSFDTDKGYQGKMQYLFTMLGKAGHHGCEMDGDETSVKSFMTKSAPQVMGLTVIGSSTNSDQDTMLKLHEGTAGAFGNMVLAPMKKLPAIKHSKCSQADGVRTVQKRSPGQLVAGFEGVLYVSPNIVMHEVYPSAFREQCDTGLYKAKMLENLNANAAKTGAVCSTKKCAGNVNGDSKIDIEDLLALLSNYGKKGC